MDIKKFLAPAEQFLRESYCIVPFQFDNKRAEDIYLSFHRLVQEPEAFRKDCSWNTLGNQESDEGLIVRAGKDGHADWKAFWHHHPHLWKEYAKTLGQKYEIFLVSLNEMQICIGETAKAFAGALDMITSNQYGFVRRSMSKEGLRQTKIRVLEYFQPPIEKPIASKHFDKSLFTFAPHSTHGSLYLGNDEEFKPAVPAGHIICFAGNKMAMVTGGSYQGEKRYKSARIPAMAHVVRATGRERENALVAFIHSDDALPYE